MNNDKNFNVLIGLVAVSCLTHEDKEKLIGFIQDLREKNKWIPVSKELPPDLPEEAFYPTVTITLKNGKVVHGFYRNENKRWYTDIDGEQEEIETKSVLAWMPLPERYEPEQSEEPWKEAVMNHFTRVE